MKGKAGKPPEDSQPLAPNEPSSPIPVGDVPQFVGIHAEFLADETPIIDLEGARFSGKTWVCCAKVVNYCLKYPGMEWLICRFSKDDALTFLKPVFQRVCNRMGHFPMWEDGAFNFSNGSLVTVGGLRSQDKLSKLSKVRGRDVAGIWNDQSEELPQEVGEELPFGTRQPGYPHPLILSPNPPDENSWLTDFCPEDNSIIGRKYYRVSLYDNPNCPEDKLAELERLYAPTHARYKTLILGLRGPSETGVPVYDSAFVPELHLAPVTRDPEQPLLEGIQSGQHHPVWLALQRNYFGGIEVLGGIMGKRLFLEDFLPLVDKYRAEWFGAAQPRRICCDPPPQGTALRFTNIQILRSAGMHPKFASSGNAPDVREAIIQSIVGYMHRRLGKNQAFVVNDDPKYWLMASHAVVKHHKFFIDGLQANYVWDEHKVSVGNKLHRRPKENEWVEGGQRCLENIVLNYCAKKPSQEQQDADDPTRIEAQFMGRRAYKPPSAWS